MRIIKQISSLSLLLLMFLAIPIPSAAQVSIGISVNVAPPELPVYEQPPCPGEDYIWTPGYWAYGDDDYYWVPGTWVLAPEPGLFWTPGYWAWRDTGYFFNPGYWGPQVGFYGGINYGYGYFGRGYEGGRWDRGHFFYNRSVNNVNVTIIHNTYNTTIVNRNETRVSYNGGRGGIDRRPDSREEAAGRERHIAAVAAQNQHIEAALANQQLRASVNHGRPPVAVTPRPGDFSRGDSVAARAGNNNVPRPGVHPKDYPAEHPAPPNTGNVKLDQKYQKQQDKLYTKQTRDAAKLQQRQDQEHVRVQKQQANEVRTQQLEQRHQQQTQQMVQRHEQQTQHMQMHQQPRQAPHPPQQHR